MRNRSPFTCLQAPSPAFKIVIASRVNIGGVAIYAFCVHTSTDCRVASLLAVTGSKHSESWIRNPEYCLQPWTL